MTTLARQFFGIATDRTFRPTRPAVIAVTLTALFCFLFVAQHVIDAGFIRRDIAALQAGEEWKTGGWLSQLVLNAVGVIRDLELQQLILSLAAASVAGVLMGVLYVRLRRNGWFIVGALVVLVAIGGHALVLYAISAASRSIPLYFALAAMIPVIRHLEDVGDVQSAIGLGLMMPLLLLAGPSTTPLVLVFALGAALANKDARQDSRAFFAMLLVAVLPTVIVGIAIVGFAAQARLDIVGVLLPYLPAYSSVAIGDWQGALLRLFIYAPVMVVPIVYCFAPRLPEKRHVWSALAVVVLPTYLAVGNAIFPWNIPLHAPAVALLATFASWLAVVRLSLLLRMAAIMLLLAATAASWSQNTYWHDAEWTAALFSPIGAPAGT
jgi:hypothetical protein